MGPKSLWAMILGIPALIVSVGGVLNVYTEWGWVTKREFRAESASHVTAEQVERMFEEHGEEPHDGVVDKMSELEAYIRIEPRLREMIKAECMGATGLRRTINQLKMEFRELTGDQYQEPPCSEFVLQ